jgi:hypothetical protein
MTDNTLRGTLLRLGLTQMEAARLMQIDPRTMRRWISGTAPIPGLAWACLAAWCALDDAGLPIPAV